MLGPQRALRMIRLRQGRGQDGSRGGGQEMEVWWWRGGTPRRTQYHAFHSQNQHPEQFALLGLFFGEHGSHPHHPYWLLKKLVNQDVEGPQKKWPSLSHFTNSIAERNVTQTPCQYRIPQFLRNNWSSWTRLVRRQQTSRWSLFARWLLEPESNMSLLSFLGRITLWLLLWWPSSVLAYVCARVCASSTVSLCTHSLTGHLECVSVHPSPPTVAVEVWQDGEEPALQPSPSSLCCLLLCSALSSHRYTPRRLWERGGREWQRSTTHTSTERLWAFCLSMVLA